MLRCNHHHITVCTTGDKKRALSSNKRFVLQYYSRMVFQPPKKWLLQSLRNHCLVKIQEKSQFLKHRRFFGTNGLFLELPIRKKIMRVPQSPHNLRKFVSTSSSDSDDSSSENKVSEQMKKPPKPFNKKKELRMHENPAYVSANRGRERTRISAVQRQIERKMAQKEKEKEKERATLFQRRSSSVGSSKFAEHDNDNACSSLSRSLSRDRLDSTSKTYIRISSNAKSSIRESSPTKKVESSQENTKEILGQNFEPLKTTEILKDLNSNSDSSSSKKVDDNDNEIKATRKISFTTEKTIVIGNANAADKNMKEDPKMRKVSIDINYVYEHQHTNTPTQIKDEKLKENEASKRRISLERRFKERRSSSLSSMSTSSNSSDTSSEGSISTPEPMPRQSKQRKISRNINIILEDEISHENSQTCKVPPTTIPGLPKPKTSFHRRFSQDHSTMNVNIPIRKISLQNNSTINTDR